MSAPNLNTQDSYFVLYLGSDGNEVRIKNFQEPDAPLTGLLQRAAACKTHAEVLNYLQELAASEEANSLKFMHTHNPDYPKHRGTFPKGVAHPCPLEEQIKFVRYKISEAEQNVKPIPYKVSLCSIQ